MKKKVAFFVAVSPNISFAAGNIAIALNKYMPKEDYDLWVYYSTLPQADIDAFEKIPNCRIKAFQFEPAFIDGMMERLPSTCRFKHPDLLMRFCIYEAFLLLNDYENVVCLDADISVQANLIDILEHIPFGISADTPWTVSNQFIAPIPGYDMDRPGVCSAVMLINDSLPYQKLYDWCYEKTLEIAPYMKNGDQAVLNLMLQEFNIVPNLMDLEEWQCIFTHRSAITAKIVHFGTDQKVWNDARVCNAFPEWYRTHLEWLRLGGTEGSSFDRNAIQPRSIFHILWKMEEQHARELKKRLPPPKAPAANEGNKPDPKSDNRDIQLAQLAGKLEDLRREVEDLREKTRISSMLRRMLLAPATCVKRLKRRPAAEKVLPKPAVQALPPTPEAQQLPQAPPADSDTLWIAFQPKGGLGDHVIALRLYEELVKLCPACSIDVICKPKYGQSLYASLPNVKAVIDEKSLKEERISNLKDNKYAIAMEVGHYVRVEQLHYNLVKRFSADLADRLQRLTAEFKNYYVPVEPYYYRNLITIKRASYWGLNRYTSMGHNGIFDLSDKKVAIPFDEAYQKDFDALGLKRYITFNQGADINNQADKTQTKVWMKEHLEKFITQFKNTHPDIEVVQIGAAGLEQIQGADRYIMGESLEVVKYILKHALLHLDCEGGLVHLASQIGTKCAVVFGPTPAAYFGYEQNINITSNICNGCIGATSDWYTNCCRSGGKQICMRSVAPELVLEKVHTYLAAGS